MHFSTLLLPLLTFAATIFAAPEASIKNTTREFQLKTKLKPGQSSGKARFNNLWLEAYHTGAGFNDAVMVTKQSAAIKGFLNGTNGEQQGVKYQNMVFDLGNDFPWTMVMAVNTNFYAAWEPVEVNAGGGASDPSGLSGFWINENGLQWTSDPTKGPNWKGNEFNGWLVCTWWHSAPQLFFRINGYDDFTPCSCADVYLVPEYI